MKTALSEGLDDKQLDQIVRRTPLGRLCELSDIVHLVRFLLSEDAAFITGQVLTVDGGLTS
jgi:3-oxoacyl-[acyl-carrier protein] reductase